MLERDFTGRIRIRDAVASDRGQAIVLGVEVVTSGCIGILVDIPEAREIFRSGDALRFTDPDRDTS